MILFILGLITAIIILACKNYDQKTEIYKLKSKLDQYIQSNQENQLNQLNQTNQPNQATQLNQPNQANTYTQSTQPVKQMPPYPQYIKYQNNQQKPQKKNVSTISVILILGSLFVIVSCLILATANWRIMTNSLRAVSILSLSAICFVISSFSERKLHLEKTGLAFYVLGSVCLPITLLTIGFLKLFGNWFSFAGDGRYILSAVMCAVSYLVFLKGQCNYKSKGFLLASIVALSGIISSTILAFIGNADIFFIISAVYSLLLTIFIPKIKLKENAKNVTLQIVKQLNGFQVFNTCFLSVIMLFVLPNSIISFVACTVFAAIFLTKPFTNKISTASVLPFSALLLAGLVHLIVPKSIDAITIVGVVLLVIISVLSMMNLLSEKVKKGFGTAVYVVSTLLLVINLRGTLRVFGAVSLEMVIITAVISVNMLIIAIRNKTKSLYNLFMVAFTITAILASNYLVGFSTMGILLFNVIILAFIVTFTFVKLPVRSSTSDVFFLVICVMSLLISNIYQFAGRGATITSWAVIGTTTAVIFLCGIVAKTTENHILNSTVKAFVPFVTISYLIPFYAIIEQSSSISFALSVKFLLWFVALIAIALIDTFVYKKSRWTNIFTAYIISFGWIFTISFIFVSRIAFIFVWLMVIFWLAKFICSQSKDKANYFILALSTSYVGVAAISKLIINSISLVKIPVYEILFAVAMQCIIYHLCYEFFKIKHKENNLASKVSQINSTVLVVISTILCLCFASTQRWLIVLAVAILAIIIRYRNKSTIAVLHLSVISYVILLVNLTQSIRAVVINFNHRSWILLCVYAGIFFIGAGLSRLVHKNKMYECVDKRKYLDVISIPLFLCSFWSFVLSNPLCRWIGMIILGLYPLLYYNRTKSPNNRKICLSFGGSALILLFWFQPFFRVIPPFDMEYYILPVFLYCALLMLIWKNERKNITAAVFCLAIISFIILALDSIVCDNFVNALILISLSLAVLVISFILRQKRWFLFAIITILLDGLYLSLRYWSSVGWWVYLLFVGILLITIGSINELRKQKRNQNIQGKPSRFMSEWKW